MQTVSLSAPPNHDLSRAESSSQHPSEARRVFFLVDSLHVGGTETQAVELARRLDPERYRVTLGCLRVRGPLLSRLEGSAVTLRECYPEGGVDSLSGIREMLKLARFFRREKVQIVHSHDLWSNLLAIPAARLARVPVVISSRRDLAHLDWYTPRRRRILRYVQQLGSAVLVNSGQIREQLITEDGFPERMIRVIHNGVDFDRFSTVVRDRERLFPGLGNCKLIVAVGNMHSDIKGQPTLIKAARDVCAKVPQAKFVLIGDGRRRLAFEAMAEEFGVKQNTIFLGQRHDIPELLAACDMAVMASKAEGFPNALLEYMAAGLPTIATDVGGNREIIQHQINGMLIKPEDPDALAQSIMLLLEDSKTASGLAQTGREMVRREFSFDRLTANIDAMYTELLHAPR